MSSQERYMGSDLYEVSVVEKTEDSLLLHIQVVHPDSMYIPEDISFALMLLAEADSSGPLFQYAGWDELMDATWLQSNARGIVSSVKLVELTHQPSKAALNYYDDPYWTDANKWLRGSLRISLTGTGWLDNIEVGQTFGSRAFSAGSLYEEREPMAAVKAAADSSQLESDFEHSAGFVALPRELFVGYTKEAPSELYFPAFGQQAYVEVDTKQTPDNGELEAYLHMPVACKISYEDSPRVGVLVRPKDGFYLLTVDKNGFGMSGVNDVVESISRIAFDPNSSTLGTPLEPCDVYKSVDPTVMKATVSGHTASLTIRLWSPGSFKFLALKLIAAPLKDELDEYSAVELDAPLADALLAHMKAADIDEWDIYEACSSWAKAESQLIVKDGYASPPENIDSFPCEVEVEVSVEDPSYLAHLTKSVPYSTSMF